MSSRRLSGRERYVVVAVSALIGAALVFGALTLWSDEFWRDRSFGRKADGLHWRFSVSTASVALVLLAISMTIGPIRRIRGLTVPIHIPWRRTVGVSAAAIAWGHMLLGLTIHSPGFRIWTQFGQITNKNFLLLLIGIGYWLGLAAALALIPLVVTSNRSWLRRLGRRRWKHIQQLSYGVLLIIIAHVMALQYQERRSLVHIGLTFSVFGIVIILQLGGFIATRRAMAAAETKQRASSADTEPAIVQA